MHLIRPKGRPLPRNKIPDVFSFRYYDVGRHRVARCKNTGVFIDSSSEVGAVYLKESEEWAAISGLTGRWIYSNGILTYERNPKHGIKSASPITAERAIGTCLKEVAKDATLVCLFRYFTSSEAQKISFGGMIKWNIAARRVELTSDIKKRDRTWTISFSPQGTAVSRGGLYRGL
ncbi:hypothetical protein F4677DRAFT_10231 [Hypoxylon crocopeplum]|nr:hypothetical protein F4677DRAFT_10231 [Hypoxylon crocopeplum]